MKTITTEKTILGETSEVLTSYFKSITKYPVYTAEEQLQLAREAQAGNERSRDKLLNSNLRFVVTCAKKYVGQGVPLVDLIQAGNLGLILSLENFNPNKKIHFISFAVWYIRREILKSIYNTGRTIRYPVTYISKISKVKKAYDLFIANEQRIPSDEELLDKSNLTEKQYNATILNQSKCQSLDFPCSEDGKTTIENLIIDNKDPISDIFTKDAIRDALKILNKKEYKVITEYYGLEGKQLKTISELSKEMGVCTERIRQLRKEAVKKLRKKCSGVLKVLL